MPSSVITRVVAGVVVLTFFVYGLVSGHPPRTVSQWLAPLGPATAVTGAGLWLFDSYAWRWSLIRRLHRRPVLNGTWHGTIVSDWVDPQTGAEAGEIEDVFIVVRQRYWHVAVRQFSAESQSMTLAAQLEHGQDGVARLIVVYANSPHADFRPRSSIHRGVAILNAPRDPEDGLVGSYFTDRKTTGSMRFHSRYERLVESHAAGLALLDPESTPATVT